MPDFEHGRLQKRHRFSFTVTWPVDLPADPEVDRDAKIGGTSYRAYYPTAAAADLAQRGFEMQGAEITP